jgi:hypothetical protein
MAIGDVSPQDSSEQPQGHSLNDTTPPTQGLDQDEHKGEDEHHDQVQEKGNDQGGDEDDGDNGETPTHPRACATFKEITP